MLTDHTAHLKHSTHSFNSAFNGAEMFSLSDFSVASAVPLVRIGRQRSAFESLTFKTLLPAKLACSPASLSPGEQQMSNDYKD